MTTTKESTDSGAGADVSPTFVEACLSECIDNGRRITTAEAMLILKWFRAQDSGQGEASLIRERDYWKGCAQATAKAWTSAKPTQDSGQGEAVAWAPMQHGPPIPMPLAELIYEAYSNLYGTSQSLQRLCERGGFGWSEVAHLFERSRIASKLLDKAKGITLYAHPPKPAQDAAGNGVDGIEEQILVRELREYASSMGTYEDEPERKRLMQSAADIIEALRNLAAVRLNCVLEMRDVVIAAHADTKESLALVDALRAKPAQVGEKGVEK